MTQPIEITSLFNYLQSKQADIIRMMEAVEEVDKLNAKPEKPEKPKKSAKQLDRIKLLVSMVNDLRRQGMTTKEACDSLKIPLSTHNCRLKRLSTVRSTLDLSI
jgi:hypothetical protein